ncbi:uncharacterized protein LOC141674885 [Apium graveolens]|uniref:uncharacterized protein LOC141674885 n=1 Tax=Apium graveolens TaxID=4045 RepID=UPI003D79BB12
MLWKEQDQARVRSFSQNHIDIEARVDGFGCWHLTGIYGEPNRNYRRKTWDLLRILSRDSNLPWCLVGDFNNIVSQVHKKGGDPYPIALVDGFNEALNDAGLIDMDIVGHQYTWERSRGKPEWVEVRLDRAVVTDSWLNEFPLAKLYNLEGSTSDHSPIILLVKENWDDDVGRDIQQKLYEEAKCKLHKVLDQREIFWRQRSKQLWLQAGDRNSRFFHNSATARRRSNQIHWLKNTEGEWRDWDSGLQDIITDYYKNLFTTSMADWEPVIDCIHHVITREQNEFLLNEIAEEEVKQALFQMHPDKALGPDGMTPAFYQKHWSIVGNDIVAMVRKFFQTGQLP